MHSDSVANYEWWGLTSDNLLVTIKSYTWTIYIAIWASTRLEQRQTMKYIHFLDQLYCIATHSLILLIFAVCISRSGAKISMADADHPSRYHGQNCRSCGTIRYVSLCLLAMQISES